MQDDETWERALSWHRRSKGLVTLHSKRPHRAPRGFIRLGYATKGSDETQGPDYLYIKPEWVFSLLPRRIVHNWVYPNGVEEPPHVGFREPGKRAELGAHIDDESYKHLKKAWDAVREPFQLRML